MNALDHDLKLQLRCRCRAPPVYRRAHASLVVRLQRSRDNKKVRLFLAIALVAVLAGCGETTHVSSPRPPHAKPRRAPGPFAHPLTTPHLARGSDPAALPGDLVIADRSNNRLLVV